MNYRNVLLLLLAASAGVSAQTVVKPSNEIRLAQLQQPIAAEKNPPGDIPDNQAFVTYVSPLGYSVKVPEGWARSESPGTIDFRDKYNTLRVVVTPRGTAPTLADLKAGEVAVLAKSPLAVRISSVKALKLPAGSAFVVDYSVNSARNPVTNKAIRLDSANYYFWNGGKLATLTLSAPAGADNVDQWQLIARSFAWH
jgi:hypothetical protein